ncbi:TonB-dependent receptor [Bowmanella pacifica]|uniref:TonB-dependent receptor n=1 Tax=Bowmanella pacifica TaxID=502051 RepID=A0A917YXA5_9ALTE|nr:TonB-dependent receptor [Bowmanella pacifica]GGO67310.1 TonB-dependent receptor [Bowmanella pacifica]
MKKSKLHTSLKAALVPTGTLLLMGVSTTYAQDNSQQEPVEEIVVKGVRGSILNNLNQKRDSGSFIDAISAEDIGKFPDLNISESLQRVPGVTLTRNDFGDGSSINLRGLGPAYSRVEINGITGPISNVTGGGFNFEILASELFSNAVVKKSFNAKDTEGGLAGLIQLSTPEALKREGFNASVSAQGQYAENADDIGPRFAGLISQNWDDVFGLTASIAYSDTRYVTHSNGGISARALGAGGTSDLHATATQEELTSLVPSTINYEINTDERETIGATLGFQYRPSEDLEIKLDGIYGSLEGDRIFTRADAPPESQLKAIENANIVDGVIQSATITDVQNRIATNDSDSQEDIFLISASASYQPNDQWEIKPYIGYSDRTRDTASSLLSFARGDLSTGQLVRYPVSYNVNGDFIEWSSPGLDLSDPAMAEEYMLNVILIRPSTDKDSEFSTKVDFTRYFDSGPISHIDFGARYSDRELSREYMYLAVDNAAKDTDLTTLPTLADALILEDFNINDAPASFPNQIITADPNKLLDMYFVNGFDVSEYWAPQTGQLVTETIEGVTLPGSVLVNYQSRAAQNTYSGDEKTLALYGEITFETEDLYFNAGLRFVDTRQTSYGYEVANDYSTPTEVNNDYSQLLPSMNLRYEVTPDMQIRASYSKSLTRPTLMQLRVSTSYFGIDESGGTGSAGNPNLSPFTSDNLDVGMEYYFSEESLLAFNLFYKNIDGLIVTSSMVEDREFRSQVTGEWVTGPITFSIPSNGDKNDLKGLEFIVQSNFEFLHESLADFGGIFNYTYADSDAAFEDGKDTKGDVAALPGISKNSYNAIIYYDNGNFDARLSYAYRSDFVESMSGSFGVPVFQNARGQLDFSSSYNLSDDLSIQLQVLNITEQRLETVSRMGLPHDTGQLDRRILLGARYQF